MTAYLGGGTAEHCGQGQTLGGVVEEDEGLVGVVGAAADLAPAVAREDELLGVAAQEAEHPHTHPAAQEDEEQEDAEDVRAGPALGDVPHRLVLAHNFEYLCEYHCLLIHVVNEPFI